MKGRVIDIDNADAKALNNHFVHIGKYVPGILKDTDLPKEVVVRDPSSGKEYQCQLIELLPFTYSIPSILCLLAEGKYPEECIESIRTRTNTKHINQLALYLYATI